MFKAKVGDQTFEFEFSDEKLLEGIANGKAFKMNIAKKGNFHHLIHKYGSYKVSIVSFDYENKTCVIQVNNNSYVVSVEDRFDLLLNQLGMNNINNQKLNDIKAPMPGLVIDIMVKPGDSVKKGDGLIIMEAMKMENIIRTSADCFVKSIEVEKADTVEKNQVLIKLE
tara:strand:+ start:34 stop:537 length:504 start_codon:yes stop_codon:yes gene_type:complete